MLAILSTKQHRQMELSQKIKSLRKQARLTQQELAEQLHIHVTHLSKIENGHVVPSIDIVKKLAQVFQVSADYLIDEQADELEVSLKDKRLSEQLALINQLDEDERQALMKVIEAMLTKKRVQDLLSGKLSVSY